MIQDSTSPHGEVASRKATRSVRRPPLRDLLLRHRHLLQHRRLQAPLVFAARMARGRGDSRMVDRHRTSAGMAPRRDLDVRRAMRRARRFQLHLYTARGSALMRRRFISPRRRRNRPRRRARRPALPVWISGRSRAASVLSRSRRARAAGPPRRRAPRLHHHARPGLEERTKARPSTSSPSSPPTTATATWS